MATDWTNTVRTRPDQAPQVSGCSPSFRVGSRGPALAVCVVAALPMSPTFQGPMLHLSKPVALVKPGPASPCCTLPPRVFFVPHLSRPGVGRRMWNPCCESPQACCCEWNGKVLPTNLPTDPSRTCWPAPLLKSTTRTLGKTLRGWPHPKSNKRDVQCRPTLPPDCNRQNVPVGDCSHSGGQHPDQCGCVAHLWAHLGLIPNQSESPTGSSRRLARLGVRTLSHRNFLGSGTL